MKLKEILETNTEQEMLDEGIAQNVFNFIWKATGDILDGLPIIGPKRNEARILKHYEDYVSKMQPAGKAKVIAAQLAKYKDLSPNSANFKKMAADEMGKYIDGILSSKNSKEYLSRLRHYEQTMERFARHVERNNDPDSWENSKKYNA